MGNNWFNGCGEYVRVVTLLYNPAMNMILSAILSFQDFVGIY